MTYLCGCPLCGSPIRVETALISKDKRSVGAELVCDNEECKWNPILYMDAEKFYEHGG